MINSKEKVTRSDVVSRFTDRITDYVEASTPFRASTSVFNTNMGSASGGEVQENTRPEEMQVTDLEDFATANAGDVLNVLAAIRNFLRDCEFNHVVRFTNTGNLGGNRQGIARCNTTHGINFTTDLVNTFANSDVASKKKIHATEFNDLIEECRTIWDNRAKNIGPATTYSYNYCHSSFSNFGNHGSRGRR